MQLNERKWILERMQIMQNTPLEEMRYRLGNDFNICIFPGVSTAEKMEKQLE